MEAEKSTLATSFLDVLSCGLGAAILLFLVFSVLPHKGISQSVGPRDIVAGAANELREFGALIDDNIKVESMNAAIVLSFPKTDNANLTLQALTKSITFENIAPASKFDGADSRQPLFTIETNEIMSATGEVTSLVTTVNITGGQKKGQKIRILFGWEDDFDSISGTCRVMVGDLDLTKKDTLQITKVTTRLTVDFHAANAGEIITAQ